MKATAVSSSCTTLASAYPAKMAQKMHPCAADVMPEPDVYRPLIGMSEHRAACPMGKTAAQIPRICTSRIVAATRRSQRQNGG
jgi:hypothetical protein